MDRRRFLQRALAGGAFAAFPYSSSFLAQVVQGWIQAAQAEELEGESDTRLYINLWIGGGAMRLTFDQWIRTQAGESIIANPYVATRYSSNGNQVTGFEYSTSNYNGVEVPYLFNTQCFNGQGAKRNLNEILPHMLVVRGFGTLFDGHDTNSLLVTTPVTGLPSMAGHIADSNSKLFAAVGGNITSLKNKAATEYTDLFLYGLFNSFQRSPANSRSVSLKETHQAGYDLAMSYLKNYARADRLGSKVLGKNLDMAAQKMRQGLSDIDSFWPQAVQRYTTAILQTARQIGVPGISDLPILHRGSGIPDALFSTFAFYHLPELGERALGQANFAPHPDFDLREMIRQMTMGSLPQQMAMAEYLLKGDYTPAINLGVGNFGQVMMQAAVVSPEAIGTPVDVQMGFSSPRAFAFVHTDMDGSTAVIPTLLLTHNFYSAILAGILELKDQLSTTRRNGRNADLWSETVIHVASEFARNGLISGTVTPHGYQHMVASIYSGAIKNGPYVVGNIQRDTGGHGTNGLMAPIGGTYPVQAPPGPVIVNSTLSSLMRVEENPWANTAPSLIKLNESTGNIIYQYEKGKIVDG